MRSVHFVILSCAIIFIANNSHGSTICKHYAQRLPNLPQTQCEAANLHDAAARSVKGRTIWTSDVKPAEADTRVLVIGGMHGDELSSAAMAFRWIQLAQAAAQNGGATSPAELAQAVHWRFIPALNPDGLFAQPAKRVNARGVDLNRNFPTPNWALPHLLGKTHRQGPATLAWDQALVRT